MPFNFRTMQLPGLLSEDDVENAFYLEQDKERAANGHAMYSGGLGMATGIKFHRGNGNPFGNAHAAEMYLQQNTKEWGPALAARYRREDQVDWMVGAWCAG